MVWINFFFEIVSSVFYERPSQKCNLPDFNCMSFACNSQLIKISNEMR